MRLSPSGFLSLTPRSIPTALLTIRFTHFWLTPSLYISIYTHIGNSHKPRTKVIFRSRQKEVQPNIRLQSSRAIPAHWLLPLYLGRLFLAIQSIAPASQRMTPSQCPKHWLRNRDHVERKYKEKCTCRVGTHTGLPLWSFSRGTAPPPSEPLV